MKALWENYSEEELKNIYNSSKNFKDFFERIGYSKRVNSKTTQKIKEKYSWFQDKRKIAKAGDKYGRLTLIKKDSNNSDKWICLCECGREISVYISNVTSGKTSSCGCKRQETSSLHAKQLNNQRSEECLKEYIGKTFNQLTILKKDEEKTKLFNKTYVLCQCNCGCESIVSVRLDSILDNNTTSCGTTKSRGNMLINSILKSLGINFKKEIGFEDLKYQRHLKFDFAIYNYKEELLCLIEYQGKQHYQSSEYWGGEQELKNRQIRDRLKKEYCKKNNIPLLEISYTDFKKLSPNFLMSLLKGVLDGKTFKQLCEET